MHRFDKHILCKVIPTTKLINTLSPHIVGLRCMYVCEHLRSTLLANFKYKKQCAVFLIMLCIRPTELIHLTS